MEKDSDSSVRRSSILISVREYLRARWIEMTPFLRSTTNSKYFKMHINKKKVPFKSGKIKYSLVLYLLMNKITVNYNINR